MFSGLTGRRVDEDFRLIAECTPAMEVLTGAMPVRLNHSSSQACVSLPLTFLNNPAVCSPEFAV